MRMNLLPPRSRMTRRTVIATTVPANAPLLKPIELLASVGDGTGLVPTLGVGTGSVVGPEEAVIVLVENVVC